MLPRSPSMAKGLIPAAAGTTDDQQLNWIMIQDLPLVERSHFIQAQMFFLGQPTYNEWLMKVGQSSGPWPQLGISLKGHSSSRTPCRNDWSVYCNCITVQPLHLVNSASFTISLLPPNWSWQKFLIKDMQISISESASCWNQTYNQPYQTWICSSLICPFCEWHHYLPQHLHPTIWGLSILS